MNVNEIICVGARPVSLVDYIALQKMNKKLISIIEVFIDVNTDANVS